MHKHISRLKKRIINILHTHNDKWLLLHGSSHLLFIHTFLHKHFGISIICCTFAVAFEAQMAESVDALVSNTSRFTPVPVRPRLWVQEKRISFHLSSFPFMLSIIVFLPYYQPFHDKPHSVDKGILL